MCHMGNGSGSPTKLEVWEDLCWHSEIIDLQ